MQNLWKILLLALTTNIAFAKIQSTNFPALDIFSEHAKDLASEKLGEAPRFAVVHDVNINPAQLQNFEKSGDQIVWKHVVSAKNAVSINLAFETFKMSENSKLNIYSSDLKESLKPFTKKHNNSAKQLWTPVIMSEEVIIELVVPASELHQVELVLTKVNQGYRTFAQRTQEKSGSCNVDVVCSEGDEWQNEINSVAVISTGGSRFCTGFMVNNTAQDKSPLFMTAYHCRVRSHNAASLVAYWNYQKTECGGNNNTGLKQYTTGSEYLAGSRKSDFALVRFNQSPEEEFGVNYAGWDRSGEAPLNVIAIHHPSTDEKSISFENDPTTLTRYLKTVRDLRADEEPTHIRIEDWDVGTTEPGSSGSPLFNAEHRVVGQLHGGYASCSSQTADWYGRLSVSWEGDGTESTSLKSHLDPAGTGDVVVDTI